VEERAIDSSLRRESIRSDLPPHRTREGSYKTYWGGHQSTCQNRHGRFLTYFPVDFWFETIYVHRNELCPMNWRFQILLHFVREKVIHQCLCFFKRIVTSRNTYLVTGSCERWDELWNCRANEGSVFEGCGVCGRHGTVDMTFISRSGSHGFESCQRENFYQSESNVFVSKSVTLKSNGDLPSWIIEVQWMLNDVEVTNRQQMHSKVYCV
jgi:hypothetical protein